MNSKWLMENQPNLQQNELHYKDVCLTAVTCG